MLKTRLSRSMDQNGKNAAYSLKLAQNGKNTGYLLKWLKIVKMQLTRKDGSKW